VREGRYGPPQVFLSRVLNRSGTAPMFGNLLKMGQRGSWTTCWLRFHFTEKFLNILSGNYLSESTGMPICTSSPRRCKAVSLGARYKDRQGLQ
jgi:hypothetical protein